MRKFGRAQAFLLIIFRLNKFMWCCVCTLCRLARSHYMKGKQHTAAKRQHFEFQVWRIATVQSFDSTCPRLHTTFILLKGKGSRIPISFNRTHTLIAGSSTPMKIINFCNVRFVPNAHFAFPWNCALFISQKHHSFTLHPPTRVPFFTIVPALDKRGYNGKRWLDKRLRKQCWGVHLVQ